MVDELTAEPGRFNEVFNVPDPDQLATKGGVYTEILPTATEEMKRSGQESIDKFENAFAEMKRLGD